MQRKVILSADSPCDLGEQLRARYDVYFFPFHILLGEQSYTDSVDIHPEDLYQAWREKATAQNLCDYPSGIYGILSGLGQCWI